ncbi:MAG: ATP-dependent Clp protease ATP-binding subunit [Verrucomicrobia bacterium]|nr:MAG: ATP-dependent Clp protease ATP-binding subunit [Verrucomicrobiota bacterium]
MNYQSIRGKLRQLEKRLWERICGQDHVIPRVMSLLERGELGLQPRERPKGSFLFLGPTGVGKTQITLEIAECLFGQQGAIRFDMSEFLHLDQVKSFVGEGKDRPGRLGIALENHSTGVLLFDEIEKAHPRIWDLFLQMLDAARITLGDHRQWDLSRFYIVCTTNIGSENLLRRTRLPFATLERTVLGQLRTHFRPELVARFDEKLVFCPLSYSVQRKIAHAALLAELARMGREGYHLGIGGSALEFIIRYGIHHSLGARPMKQAVLKYIGDAICADLRKGGNGCGYLVAAPSSERLIIVPEKPDSV